MQKKKERILEFEFRCSVVDSTKSDAMFSVVTMSLFSDAVFVLSQVQHDETTRRDSLWSPQRLHMYRAGPPCECNAVDLKKVRDWNHFCFYKRFRNFLGCRNDFAACCPYRWEQCHNLSPAAGCGPVPGAQRGGILFLASLPSLSKARRTPVGSVNIG